MELHAERELEHLERQQREHPVTVRLGIRRQERPVTVRQVLAHRALVQLRE